MTPNRNKKKHFCVKGLSVIKVGWHVSKRCKIENWISQGSEVSPVLLSVTLSQIYGKSLCANHTTLWKMYI